MTLLRSLIALMSALVALTLSPIAVAQAVNLEAGEWEYTNELVFGPGMSPQTQVFTDCVTEDEIKEGSLLGLTIEGCEIHEQRIWEDGLRYVMTCTGPEGTSLSVDAEIEFDGDRASGVIRNTVATPMGDLEMLVNMTARRLGDCSESTDEN